MTHGIEWIDAMLRQRYVIKQDYLWYDGFALTIHIKHEYIIADV
jgi:hypothetical protein